MTDEESTNSQFGGEAAEQESNEDSEQAGQFDPTAAMDRDEILDTFAELGAVDKEATSHLEPDILRRFLESEKAAEALEEKPPADDNESATVNLELGALREFLADQGEVPESEQASAVEESGTHNLDPREVQYIIEGEVEQDLDTEGSEAVSLDKEAIRQFMDVDEATQESDEMVDENTGATGGPLDNSDAGHVDQREALRHVEQKKSDESGGSSDSIDLNPALEIEQEIDTSYRTSPADGSTDRLTVPASDSDDDRSGLARVAVILAGTGLVLGITAGYLQRSGVWGGDGKAGEVPDESTEITSPSDRDRGAGRAEDDRGGTEKKEKVPSKAGSPLIEQSAGAPEHPSDDSFEPESDGSNNESSDKSEQVTGEAPTRPPSSDDVTLDERVHFRVESTDLHTDSRAILDRVAQTLRDHSDLEEVRIEGHSDNRGTDEVNERLARIRAQTVRDYLIEKEVDSDRLEVVSYGANRPVASNDSRQGRARNRRVQIVVTDAEGQQGGGPATNSEGSQ